MTRHVCVLGGIAALCVAAGVTTIARLQNQQPPVFRRGVNVVYVDAYPRRDGRIVEGLRPEDFQVFEDGKPQKVDAFEFIRTEANAVDAERRDPNTKEEGDTLAADPHNRVFVVYLDIVHTSFNGSRDSVSPLLQFLNRTIGPTDLFAVMTPYVPKPVRALVFAKSTTLLEGELSRNADWGESGRIIKPMDTFEEQALSSCADASQLIRLHREDLMASSLEELTVHLRDLRDERKNVLLLTGGWTPRRGTPIQMGRGSGSIPGIGVDPRGRLGIDTPQPGQSNSGYCDRLMAQVSGIDFEQRFRDLLTRAREANVSFYPIDVGGLQTFAPTASMQVTGRQAAAAANAMRVGGESNIDTLKTLAENTDGRAIVNTNDLGAGFRQIADDLSGYYLLGYTSTNSAFDGKFRRIDVKVNQSKVSVTARRGYLASNADPAAFAAKASAPATPAGVTEELARLSRLRADAVVFGYAQRSATGLELPIERALAEMEHPEWRNGADLRVAVKGAGPDPVEVSGRFDPVARGLLVHVPLLPADTGPWRAKVRITSPGRTIDEQLEIVAPLSGPVMGAPVVFRGTPSPRVPLRPVADFQFRRAERLHVEWPALKPIDQRTARVLDRRGQPLAIEVGLTERPDAGNGSAIAADLQLAPLAEGDYLLELSAGAGRETERSLLAFRIVR